MESLLCDRAKEQLTIYIVSGCLNKIKTKKVRSNMVKMTRSKIAAFVLFVATISFSPSCVWADAGDKTSASTFANKSDADRGYVNKSYHDGQHTYKHPNQRSFTGPFDYGNRTTWVEPAQASTCNCFTFDATKSSSFDGQRLTYLWDFGDGQTSDKPVVHHCFDKAGEYNVTLTAKDNSGRICDTGLNSTKVISSFPPTAVAGPDKQACLGQAVSFDASASSTSNPSTYTWNFGDGESAQGEKVTHTYQKAGQYRADLTINDGRNSKCSIAQNSTTVNISQNTAVQLTAPVNSCVGKKIAFNALGTGGNYSWDFGDGTVINDASSASHSYQKAGTYNVSVNVNDGRGSACSTASDVKKITINEPPIAKAGENTACLVGTAVNFDGSGSTSSTGNLSYNWNFGDGESADGPKVSHTYQKNGDYRVTLTVNDRQGGECSVASDSFVANVHTAPDAVINVR